MSDELPWWRQPGWQSWMLGAGIGGVAQTFFIGSYITWFIGALCHEMGHVLVAWLTGHPALPAIRLDGHAAAVHGERSLLLALVPLVACAVVGWRWREQRGLAILCAVLGGILALALVWQGWRETLHLFAGQGGELAFGGVFLWRAYTGGYTEQPIERPLYAALGWLFVWHNLALGAGLMFSDNIERAYRSGGSFGLRNDLVRIAEDWWGTSLELPALLLLLAALATPTLAWWLGRGQGGRAS